MRVLIACEFSGIVREAFRRRGHDAWSCDLLPAEDSQEFHICGDVLDHLDGLFHQDPWDMMIAHPPCTRLTNSGVRWLHKPPRGRTKTEMWLEMNDAAEFYIRLRDAKIPKKCIENPIMHKHAFSIIGAPHGLGQTVQPWWFGDPYFKATRLELIGLPFLKPTNELKPPPPYTEEHKKWSKIHREPPSPERWKNRSRTFPGIAEAMAEQWGR